MDIALIYDFPPFDTGLVEGAFSMAKGDAELVVSIAEHDAIVLSFKRVRWHEFTALYNCSPEQAYRELHHFRVFVDGHGCHEVFAESAGGCQK